MLINKLAEPGDILCFKLVTGDEVVAKLVEATPVGFVVNRPCTVIPSQQGIGLMQSLFSAEVNKDIELKSEHVMLHSTVIKALEDHYLQTTTGIQTVSKGPLIV